LECRDEIVVTVSNHKIGFFYLVWRR